MPTPPISHHVHPPALLSIKDTLHNVSAPLVRKLVAAIPKPLTVADTGIAGEVRRLGRVIQQASEPSGWDYWRDGATIIIAFVSVGVALWLASLQRRQQLKDTRLAWIRLFIIEPQSAFILKFFENLEITLMRANISPLPDIERASIVAEINSNFGELSKRFLSYTDSIGDSSIPKQLRTIAESQQDDLADLIDTFNNSDQAGSYKKLVARVTSGRNSFLAALYSLSFK